MKLSRTALVTILFCGLLIFTAGYLLGRAHANDRKEPAADFAIDAIQSFVDRALGQDLYYKRSLVQLLLDNRTEDAKKIAQAMYYLNVLSANEVKGNVPALKQNFIDREMQNAKNLLKAHPFELPDQNGNDQLQIIRNKK